MEPCPNNAHNSCDHQHHEETTDETVRVQDRLSHIQHKLIVMSGYVCPHCRQESPLFGQGGGNKTAEQMKVHFLGSLPFDPRVVEASDLGHLLAERENGGAFTFALAHFVSDVIDRSEALAEKPRPRI